MDLDPEPLASASARNAASRAARFRSTPDASAASMTTAAASSYFARRWRRLSASRCIPSTSRGRTICTVPCRSTADELPTELSDDVSDEEIVETATALSLGAEAARASQDPASVEDILRLIALVKETHSVPASPSKSAEVAVAVVVEEDETAAAAAAAAAADAELAAVVDEDEDDAEVEKQVATVMATELMLVEGETTMADDDEDDEEGEGEEKAEKENTPSRSENPWARSPLPRPAAKAKAKTPVSPPREQKLNLRHALARTKRRRSLLGMMPSMILG